MNIGFLLRASSKTGWGGDLLYVKLLAQGLERFGYSIKYSDRIDNLLDCHFVFLSFSLWPLVDAYLALKRENIPYAVIPFYENEDQFLTASKGLYVYLYMMQQQKKTDGIDFNLETLQKRPYVLDIMGPRIELRTLQNRKVFENAKFCLTNSPTESKTMKNDFDSVTTESVLLPVGLMTNKSTSIGDEILDLTGLKSKSYLLQIGRIETRKNQLSTVLATRNLEQPLVLIAAKYHPQLLELLIDLIKEYRKAKTYIITQNFKSQDHGNLKIINYNSSFRMPNSLILSAYKHAGLYIHPAFQEVPGLIYLEALHFNIPIVASNWTTIKDYLTDPVTGEYQLDERITFCTPHHIEEIENAVRENFGKTFEDINLPIMNKTIDDFGKETAELIEKYTSQHYA